MTGSVATPDGERSQHTTATGRVVFDSVEQMLAPASLSQLLGTPIASVDVSPLESNGFSTNELSYIQAGDHRLVLKRLSSDDWLTRGSEDDGCRSLAVWRTGLLDRLEPELRHGILAGSRDGAHHALLMRDVSAGLDWVFRPILTRVDTRDRRTERILESLAVTHARFWGDDTLADPAYELADVETLMTTVWPKSWPSLQDAPAPGRLPYSSALEFLQKGWQALHDRVDPDVRVTIEQVMADPGPLVDALATEPATLLHGDFRPDNLAVMPDDSVVAFDWQFAGRGPGVLDLAFLVSSVGVFEYRGWAFEYYRDALFDALDGDLDVPRWDRALAIAQFAHVLRVGCFTGFFAIVPDDEPPEWTAFNSAQIQRVNEVVRRGADLL